jgi:hypothetical protein
MAACGIARPKIGHSTAAIFITAQHATENREKSQQRRMGERIWNRIVAMIESAANRILKA